MSIKSIILEELLQEAKDKPRKAFIVSSKKKTKPTHSMLSSIEKKMFTFGDKFVKIKSTDDDWLDVDVYMQNFTIANAIANVKKLKSELSSELGFDVMVSVTQ